MPRRRAARASKSDAPRRAPRLAARGERRRGGVASAVHRADPALGGERAGDDRYGDICGAARQAPAGGRAASIRAARQSLLSPPVSRALAPGCRAHRRIRTLAEYDRRTEARGPAARHDQRPDQRTVVQPLAESASVHRRASIAIRCLPRAQRRRRRAPDCARRASAFWSPATSSSTRRRCRRTVANSPSSPA